MICDGHGLNHQVIKLSQVLFAVHGDDIPDLMLMAQHKARHGTVIE
jgi:hypothetical protein